MTAGEADVGPSSQDNLLMLGESVSKSSAYLFVGRFVSLLIGFVGLAVTARLLADVYRSSDAFGWLFIVSSLPTLIALPADMGLSSGMTNRIIRRLANGDRKGAQSYFSTWIVFELVLSLLYASIALALGNLVVLSVFSKPQVLFLVPLAVASIPANYLFQTSWGGCIATDFLWANSIMLIVQFVIQAVASPLLILMGYGIWGVVFVYLVASPTIAGLIGLAISVRAIGLSLPNRNALKDAFAFGFPLGGGGVVSSAQAIIINGLLSRFGTATQLGNYSVAQRLSLAPEAPVYPLNTLLFPTFSKLVRRADVSSVFSRIIRFEALVVFPISLFILSSAGPLLETIYGSAYVGGGSYLALLSLLWLTSGLGELVASQALAGQGRTDLALKLGLTQTATTLGLGFILIPLAGVEGAIAASIIAVAPTLGLSLHYTKRHLGTYYPGAALSRTLGASVAAVGISYLVVLFFPLFAPPFKVVLSLLVSFSLYIFLVKRVALIESSELDLLEKALSPIPVIGKVVKGLSYIYKRI